MNDSHAAPGRVPRRIGVAGFIWARPILIISVGGGSTGTIVTYIDQEDGAVQTVDLDVNRVTVARVAQPPDAETLAAAMNEVYTYEDDDFWGAVRRDVGAMVAAKLREMNKSE